MTSVLNIDSCKHSYIVHNGTRVCTLCGLCDDGYTDFDNRLPFKNPTIRYPIVPEQSTTVTGNVNYKTIHPNNRRHINSANQRISAYRIKKLNSRYNHDSTVEYRIFKFLLKVKGTLDLPEHVYLEIIHKYRTLFPKLQKKCRRSYILLATIIAVTVKNTVRPISRTQIIDVFKRYGHKVNNKNINDCILDLNLNTKNVDISDIFPLLLGKLNIVHDTHKVLFESNNILNKCRGILKGRGFDPYAFAGAIIYYSLKKVGREKHQKEIAKATNSTPVTIMNHLKRIVRIL